MNNLERHIENVRRAGKKLFCAYITLGYPSLSFTERLAIALERIGVDIIEIGIPFSDPLADGPTIQESSYYSLQKGTTVHDAFWLLRRLRQRGFSVPVVFFSYYNIIFHYGLLRCVRQLRQSGFDGVLCPDLPPEEDRTFALTLRRHSISLIYLVAPTSSPARMKMLAHRSGGFIYYVSRRGVTGARHDIAADLSHNIGMLRRYTTKSILVGFGVSDAHQIKTICRLSDGVIVGSAIIDYIKKSGSVSRTAHFVQKLIHAVRRA